MRSSQIKLGRNDICSCGSGNKYKKCCLSTKMQPFSEKVSFISIDRKKSPQRLTKRIKDNISDQFILLAGEHEIKMSEIILHLAEDLLSFARTKSQIRKAVTAACTAWNLALMFDSEQLNEKLEEFLNIFDDRQAKQDTRDIIYSIIKKKNLHYSDVNRIIIDFELVGGKNDFHLNVVSTVPQEDIAQLN